MSSPDPAFPPCGLYRTLAAIGEVPAGRLVYFHNHGDPGPGIYLPSGWKGNRAEFHAHGQVLADPESIRDLEPVEPEGLYRVAEPFHCCEKECRLYEEDALVQLGYDGLANPILFVPELVDGMVALPERGARIDRDRIAKLRPLGVPTGGGRDADPTH